MTGKVTITAFENGIGVQTEIKHATNVERLALIDALGTALGMKDLDWKMFYMARKVGVFEGTVVDMSLLKKGGMFDDED